MAETDTPNRNLTPSTRKQAATMADLLAEQLLEGDEDSARESFERLAEYFEEDEDR